jgi:hypothetical protein
VHGVAAALLGGPSSVGTGDPPATTCGRRLQQAIAHFAHVDVYVPVHTPPSSTHLITTPAPTFTADCMLQLPRWLCNHVLLPCVRRRGWAVPSHCRHVTSHPPSPSSFPILLPILLPYSYPPSHTPSHPPFTYSFPPSFPFSVTRLACVPGECSNAVHAVVRDLGRCVLAEVGEAWLAAPLRVPGVLHEALAALLLRATYHTTFAHAVDEGTRCVRRLPPCYVLTMQHLSALPALSETFCEVQAWYLYFISHPTCLLGPNLGHPTYH